MNTQLITNEAALAMQQALQERRHWLVYDMEADRLSPDNMQFLKSKSKAIDYAFENNSSTEVYRVIHFNSVDEAIKNIHQKKQLDMNEKNLEALKSNLRNLGFGEGLNEQLEKNIKEQKPEFNLNHQIEYNNRKINFDLSFRAGEQNEMYFFNRYKATLENQPERSQVFYLDRGNGVTTKEAFNLLEGRAVNKDLTNKEGEKYNAWVQLDLSKKEENGNYKLNRYHENYNFNFKAEVDKLILKPMTSDLEKQFVKSLEKGNVQSAVFLKNGEEVRLFVEANPKERTLNLYDGKMNRLSEEQKADYVDLKASTKKHSQNQSVGGGEDEGPELKKKRTRGQKNGMSV
jgi:hypothetical protein